MATAKRYAPRHDVSSPAQTITDAIIARLEAGTRPWQRPWTGTAASRPTRWQGDLYRGINAIWLALIADLRGFTSPFWMTYRQASELGGQVRRGEKSTIAVFYKSYGKQVEDRETGEDRTEARRVLRSYPVFNASQIDGLPERFHPKPVPILRAEDDPVRRAELQDALDAIPASVRHGGDKAYYAPSADFIQMPEVEAFKSFESYAAVRFHESIHWSGADHRLCRTFGQRFGDEAYAMEELVAELGSAIVGAELGLPVEHLDDHASYIASWLRVLRADSKAILTVAARADEAASYLLGFGGRTPAGEDEPEHDGEPANDHTPAPVAIAA